MFYIIMAFLTIGFIIAECVLPSERSQIASDENIRKELLDNCGTQFDPQISKMFVDMLDNGMVVIDENNKSVHGYQDNADIESAADKFISEVMKTMSSQEKADSIDYLTGLHMRSRGQQIIAALMQENDGCLAFIDMDICSRKRLKMRTLQPAGLAVMSSLSLCHILTEKRQRVL